MRCIRSIGWPVIILCAIVEASFAQAPFQKASADLDGTSWKLLEFQGRDGATLTPEDTSNYTLSFSGDGVSIRIDCNRGHGSWTSKVDQQLEFGPLALTRAMCPPAALSDRLMKDWDLVRSYTRKSDHLFLALADGGTYEYELMARLHEESEASETNASPFKSLPASFSGTLPCADCPGIRYRITLNADHTFTSRMTYEERSAHVDESGRWDLAEENRVLILRGDHADLEKFSIRDPDTLRKLDRNGDEINSTLNYELRRERTSLSKVDSTIGNGSLEGTNWTLTYLQGASLTVDSQRVVPYMVLDATTHRVSGSSGCNRLMGSYEAQKDRLKFSQIAGTMMMCPQGMEIERAFLQSLAKVNTWKLDDRSLQLFDQNGKLLSRFKASSSP